LILSFVQIEKILKDMHGPALALVVERLKPYGAFQGGFVGSLANFLFG
jgi:cytoskeleton-associated protein 5